MQKAVVTLCILLQVLASKAWAYNVNTHQAISIAAVKASILADPNGHLLSDLGLDIAYLGLDPTNPSNKFIESKTITQWIGYGAIAEDNGTRPLNHFFDPAHGGRPLTWHGIALGNPSPDWALEDQGNIAAQDFSLKDARGYFYQALTSATQAERDQNFGLTFQTLGQVIHHVQDMAQPQHVRNDMHCDSFACRLLNVYNRSLYESYTDGRRDALPYTGYAPVYPGNGTLDQARQWWTTDQGAGIAQFTNANFLSAGTNFRGGVSSNQIVPLPNEDYPLPVWNGTTEEIKFDALLKDFAECPTSAPPPPLTGCGIECGGLPPGVNPPPATTAPPACQLTGTMVFFGSDVTDHYLGGPPQSNPRASTLSIFDQDLTTYGKQVSYPNLDQCTNPADITTCATVKKSQIFSLNKFNFEAAYPFLIPRAVGYRAMIKSCV
ncbi:MAG: phospholipase C/P1 nuclease family protein [Acidiferrobacterales bacterium]